MESKERTYEQAQSQKDVSISDLLRGDELSNTIHVEKRDAEEARAALDLDGAQVNNTINAIKNVANMTTRYMNMQKTGYDSKHASIVQKIAASFGDKGKRWAAKRQKHNYTKTLYKTITEVQNMIGDTNKNIEKAKTMEGKLEDFRHIFLKEKQESAIQIMNHRIGLIEDLNVKIKGLKKELDEIVANPEYETSTDLRQLKLDKNQALSETEGVMSEAQRDLVKATIKYESAEDHFYMAQETITQYRNLLKIMDIETYRIAQTVENSEKHYKLKIPLNKLSQAGAMLVDLDKKLGEALTADAILVAQRINNLAKVVESDVDKRIYAPIIPGLRKLNNETRDIINAAHAYYVEKVQSAEYTKDYSNLDEDIASGKYDSQIKDQFDNSKKSIFKKKEKKIEKDYMNSDLDE